MVVSHLCRWPACAGSLEASQPDVVLLDLKPACQPGRACRCCRWHAGQAFWRSADPHGPWHRGRPDPLRAEHRCGPTCPNHFDLDELRTRVRAPRQIWRLVDGGPAPSFCSLCIGRTAAPSPGWSSPGPAAVPQVAMLGVCSRVPARACRIEETAYGDLPRRTRRTSRGGRWVVPAAQTAGRQPDPTGHPSRLGLRLLKAAP